MSGPRTDWDCGDNSCRYAGRGQGGMRTNGGCRCDDKAHSRIIELEAELQKERLSSISDLGQLQEAGEKILNLESENKLLAGQASTLADYWSAREDRLRSAAEKAREALGRLEWVGQVEFLGSSQSRCDACHGNEPSVWNDKPWGHKDGCELAAALAALNEALGDKP